MRHWFYAFRGAFLTWVALPLCVVFFVAGAIGWAVATSYHPMAPVAFQGPYLAVLVIATILALIFLAVLHGTQNRRARVMRNLAEMAGLAATFVVAFGLIVVFIDGPKTQTLVLFGETYHVPTHYRPYVSKASEDRASSLVLEVCGPNDAPVYVSLDCRDTALVRYSNEALLQEFDPSQRLKEAGARHIDDTLEYPGQHRPGIEPGEIIYRQSNTEMRLWLDPARRVTVLRLCKLAYGTDCTAMVRIDDRSIYFPVHDMDGMASKTALLNAGKLWVERIESWRCAPSQDCTHLTE